MLNSPHDACYFSTSISECLLDYVAKQGPWNRAGDQIVMFSLIWPVLEDEDEGQGGGLRTVSFLHMPKENMELH